MANSQICGTGKPIVVMSALPCAGHTEPLIQVSEYLTQRGFEVHFLAGPAFKGRIEGAGARWYNNPRITSDAMRDPIAKTPPGWIRLYKHLLTSWIYGVRERHYRIRLLLEIVRQLHPDREVVVITEPMCTGFLPFYFDAPLPYGYVALPKVISIHVFPIWITSVDTAPFGLGMAPGCGRLGRLVNRSYRVIAQPIYAFANRETEKVYKSLGTTMKMDEWILDVMMNNYDVTLTPTVPSLEYRRRDLPENVKFIGCWPPKEVSPTYRFPSWWADVLNNHQLPQGHPRKRKLAVVCQGTIAVKYENLIIPAIKAMKTRPHVLLVAILGIKGAALSSSLEGPANVLVADYMPYDAAFPLCNFIICNAGWGGFHHAVSHGVPMIVAGLTEDKREVSMRGEQAGNAINLRTETPGLRKLGRGIDKILEDRTYAQRAIELKQESDSIDPLGPLGRIEAHVLEFGALRNTIPLRVAENKPIVAMNKKLTGCRAKDIPRRSSERTIVVATSFDSTQHTAENIPGI